MEVITLLLLLGTCLVECQANSNEVVQPFSMTVIIVVFAVVVLLVVIILLLAFNLIEARKRHNEPSERQHGEVKKDNELVLAGKYKVGSREMEVLNTQLTDFADTFRDIPKNMRLFSLCMRALYAEHAIGTSSSTARKLNRIRNDTRRDALVYVNGILPVSTSVVRSLKEFFDMYDSLDFDEWREYLPSILEDVKGHRQCCETLVKMHQVIMVPLKKRQDEARVLISELTGLTEELEAKTLELETSAKSKDKWACHLLFIPGLNVTVAPLLKLSAAADNIKAVADGQQSKINRSTIIVVSETMMPAISAFVDGLNAAAGFFKVIENDIASFEHNKVNGGSHQQLHYKIMKKQAAKIATHCREFYAMLPDVESDFKAIPEMPDDKNYVQRWLENQQKQIKEQYAAKITDPLKTLLGYLTLTADRTNKKMKEV
ncbi:uncharacterized protein [Apostichopus japonicus]|uniref:uncharacterized protein n=1 Tax=Stichopus japonicus TaxID=307972 RepID=UPI003AB27878